MLLLLLPSGATALLIQSDSYALCIGDRTRVGNFLCLGITFRCKRNLTSSSFRNFPSPALGPSPPRVRPSLRRRDPRFGDFCAELQLGRSVGRSVGGRTPPNPIDRETGELSKRPGNPRLGCGGCGPITPRRSQTVKRGTLRRRPVTVAFR